MKDEIFGHLKVIKKSKHTNKAQQDFWVCQCICGKYLIVRGDNLRRSISTQCSECRYSGRRSRFCDKEGNEL